MKLKIFFKGSLGLIYTVIIFLCFEFCSVWLSQFLIKLNWGGAAIFWIFGVPLIIGIIQLVTTLFGIPIVYLMRGSRWLAVLLLIPGIYCVFSFGRFLWLLASGIGGVLIWLLAISWFCETAWVYVAYLQLAFGSAFEEGEEYKAF